MKKINYASNEELKEIKNDLISNGYRMKADSYWTQIFENGNDTIVTERD